MTKYTREELTSFINRAFPHECLFYNHEKVDKYRKVNVKGERIDAHRLMLRIFNGGQLPEGLITMHTCDNKACVNPRHLLLATYSENLLDARAKGINKGWIGPRPSKYFPQEGYLCCGTCKHEKSLDQMILRKRSMLKGYSICKECKKLENRSRKSRQVRV